MIFRQNAQQAHLRFAIMTYSGEYDGKNIWDEFRKPGEENMSYSINIDTMDDTIVRVYREDGSLVAEQVVSPGGGDITIILPNDGIRWIELDPNDPNAVEETDIWVGPYSRSDNINTIDAR
jgi:hypothetical protein